MYELIQGDCLEKMKSIPDGSIDMVLTDPPYGTTACKWDSVIDLPLMWKQLNRVIKSNGAVIMTAAQPFTTTLISSNLKAFKYEMAWIKNRKTGQLNAKNRPMVSHENIIVFYNRQPIYHPYKNGINPRAGTQATPTQTKNYRRIDNQDKYSRPKYLTKNSVLSGFNVESRGLHPTQKPVDLMEYLIKTYTNEGETVLDFTMGSGTTGVACGQLGRRFIGIELDEKFFKIAEARIYDAYGGDLLN